MNDQTLLGTLDHITFQNPESHFLVGRLLAEERPEPVTIKGRLYNVHEGQTLKVWGRWEEHREYGLQFVVDAFMEMLPSSLAGMERYLASGIIKGVGPTLAARIVKTFGERTFDVIDREPERLLEVPKFPRKALAAVKTTWLEQRAIREIMVFLHAQGISQAYAERIFRTYGFGSVEVIRDNPYRLAMDVQGIGFRIADAIAGRVGIPRDAPQRAEAGIVYVVEEAAGQGHTGYPRERLVTEAARLLEVEPELAARAIDVLTRAGLLRAIPAAGPEGGEPFLCRPRFFKAEREIARHLARIEAARPARDHVRLDERVTALERGTGIALAPEQREAVRAALDHKALIVTGGPGTGKTTIVRFILELCREPATEVALAAPTGRAAKRLAEATGRVATTIHRLLEAGPKGFGRGTERPIAADLVIVDECSMIDTLLMQALLAAIPAPARLVLVGDVDQLPSVGPGMVLSDLIASGRLPVVRLERIFRQSERSRITVNAHGIRRGEIPELRPPPTDDLLDFYFIPEADPDRIVEKLLRMLTERIPQRFGFDPKREVQVLTPMHKGTLGAINLNHVLQASLNPGGETLAFGGQSYRVGDKVMQTKNDYAKDVFNGDMGEIVALDKEHGTVAIAFDDRPVEYEGRELESVSLGYAITVHKSQGSEYPAVILPLTTQHAIMLQRNLLYTAITRARQLCVLIGTERAVHMAVHNAKPILRHTRLRQHLAGGVAPAQDDTAGEAGMDAAPTAPTAHPAPGSPRSRQRTRRRRTPGSPSSDEQP